MKTDEKALKKIVEKFKLKGILLFGSQVTERTHPDSDIDIAVLNTKNLSLNDRLDLFNELSELFPGKLDLTPLLEASPLLKMEVAKNSKLLFGEKTDYHNFLVNSAMAFLDFEPYFKLRKETNKKALTSL